MEDDEEFTIKVVGLGGGHTANDGVERHALVFLHEGTLYAPHPVPGLNDGVGEWGVISKTRGVRAESPIWRRCFPHQE